MVVGATGVIGAAATEHFCRRGWKVTTMSRRDPHTIGVLGDYDAIQVDLTDADACHLAVAQHSVQLADVHSVIYTALLGVDVWDADVIETNEAMLRNCLLPLEAVAAGSLRHVDLLQGRKAYPMQPDPLRWPV